MADGAAGFLEGLVGGALTGMDIRRTRSRDRMEAEELARKRKQDAEDRRLLAEERARTGAIQDLALRSQYGLSFDQPRMSVDELRKGTGEALKTFSDLEVPGARAEFVQGERRREELGIPEPPPGMYRVGPSQAERGLEAEEKARALRVATGERLASGLGLPMSGEQVAAAADFDVLDELMSRSETAPYRVNVGGISTDARTPEEAIAARERFTPTPEAKPVDPASLRTEFRGDPIVKESATVAQAYQRLKTVGTAPPSGAGDLAVIFSFMKLVDPGSTVREGEFANAENAQGVDSRLRNLHNRVLRGERLSEEARADFLATADGLAQAQAQSLRPVLARYTDLAGRSGIDPAEVVSDPFSALNATRNAGPGELARITAEMTPEEILALIQQSPARGPGG